MNNTSFFYKITFITLLAFFYLANKTFADSDVEQTITKEINVNQNSIIKLVNKIGPVTVETWDKNVAKIDIRINADGNEAEIKKLIDYIKTLNFEQSGDIVLFNTKFYNEYNENNIFLISSIKMILKDNSKINLSKLSFSFLLTIPKNNSLSITNKYSKLILPDLNSNLTLELYESDFNAGSIGGNLNISMKYGKGDIGSVKDLKIETYEATLFIQKTSNVKGKLRYSKLSINEAGTLNLDSYEDQLNISKHSDIDIIAKYTKAKLADFGLGKFNFYECKVSAGKINTLSLDSKYSEFEFSTVQSLKISEAYESRFEIGAVNELTTNSKYSKYYIGALNSKLIFSSSYEDIVNIKHLNREFSEIKVYAKYSNFDVTTEAGAIYKISTDLQYTDFKHPEDKMEIVKQIKDDSKLIYFGFTKGANKDNCPSIDLKMYEGEFYIK